MRPTKYSSSSMFSRLTVIEVGKKLNKHHEPSVELANTSYILSTVAQREAWNLGNVSCCSD